MNKEIYEKNMAALQEKYPIWAIRLEHINRKKRGFDVIPEQSLSGDTILKVRQGGRTLYLNGRYAPEAPIERWLGEQGEIPDYAPVIVVGISNGYAVRRIMEEMPDTARLLVYEPSLEIFRRAMEEVDLTFLFQPDIPVGIVVDGLNEWELINYLFLFISFDNFVFIRYFQSGNYLELFPEQVTEFVRKFHKHIYDLQVSWNTQVRYTEINAKNVFTNIHFLLEGYSLESLRGILPPDVPAIVVSAGPSLNKNLKDLKAAEGKACIIATDTAMKPLLNAGIIPHLFVIVDGLKPGILFDHKELSKVPMVTNSAVSVEAMQMHKGRKYFYPSGSGLERKLLEDLGGREGKNCMLPDLPTGGSVANSAYSLGIFMGAKTVILIGQDLALTGNKTHADGTFQEHMEEVNTEGYPEVEAIGGGMVKTRPDLKLYLDWYEARIKEWKHITTVDATEGGALIHGSKVMTLKAAIRKYCKREFNVKWHISHTKKLFSDENYQIALELLAESDKKLVEVERKAKEGLTAYKRLKKLLAKNGTSDQELKKALKKIKRVNRYMETDYMACTVTESMKSVELMFRPLIYQLQEDRNAELNEIAEQGILMLQTTAGVAEAIRKISLDTVVPYAKEHMDRGDMRDKGNGKGKEEKRDA